TQGVWGALTISSQTGSTALTVDDSGDAASRTVTVNDQAISGLTTYPMTYLSPNVASVTVATGSGPDTVTVARTSRFATTLLTTSGGQDTVTVGHDRTVRDIQGPLTISNPSSFTTLTIDDNADTAGRNVTLTSTGVTGLAPGAISFPQSNLHSLDIY